MKRICAGILFAVLIVPARAQSQSDVQADQSGEVVCEASCRVVQTAGGVLLDKENTDYPGRLVEHAIEGLVELAYDIGPDGHTGNITVLNQFGSSQVVQKTVAVVKALAYTPPVEDGQPTTIRGRTRFKIYRIWPEERHDAFASQLSRAGDLRMGGKLDDALAAIDDAITNPGGSFDEYAQAACLKADIQLQQGDVTGAQKTMSGALLLIQSRALSLDGIAAIHRTHIKVAMAAHLYPDAVMDLQRLRGLGVPQNDDDKAAAAALSDIMAKGGMHTVHARIDGTEPGWARYSVIGGYSIANESGTLTRSSIYCRHGTSILPEGDMRRVTIPAGWRDCLVTIFGAPGTEFDLISK